jgi:DNA-binding CsgD family transcriptional regulator/tetratricopeptide (TPR) repeat protein
MVGEQALMDGNMELVPERSIVCPVLIGRAHYFAPYEQALVSLADGAGNTIALSGEAGIGKSRLTRELTSFAERFLPDLLVLRGHCFERDSTLPFAPLLDLLRTYFATLTDDELCERLGDEACELVKLLPEIATAIPECKPTPTLDPEQEKRRLFHALVRFFLGIARERPLLVVIEDLHWSDDTSLEFLSHLARHAAESRILLTFTYRADEVNASLAHFLAGLDRARVITEWRLARLSLTDVAAMIAAIFELAQQPRAEFVAPLYELTDGNPYFIEEVLKSLMASGDIFYEQGAWDRKPMSELNIPRSVQDAVRQRSSRTSEGAQRLLTYAAVAGRRFDIDLLLRVTGHSEAEMLALVKELIAAQLVSEESDDQFVFRHALTQQAIYTALLARERRALHREVATCIEASGGTDDARIAEMAHHFYEAAIWARAFDYSCKIGDRAQKLLSPAASVLHFTRALDAASRAGTTPPAWVYSARGNAYQTLGDFAQARADHEAALEASRARADRTGEWQALIDLGFLWATRDYDRSGDFFRRALDLARASGDSKLLAISLNRLGNWLVNIGRAPEGIEQHQAALAIFEASGDKAGMGATYDLLGMANGMVGDLPAAVDYYGRAIPLLAEAGDDTRLLSALSSLVVWGSTNHADVIPGGGRTLEETRGDGDAAFALVRRTGSSVGLAYAHWTIAGGLGAFGVFGEALNHAREGLRIAREIEHEQWTIGAQFKLAQLRWHLLDYEGAARELEEALPPARALKSAFWIGNIGCFLALAYLQLDRLDEAEAVLDAVEARDAEPRTMPARRLRWARAELTLARGDAARALEIVDAMLASSPGPKGAPIPPLLWTRARALSALGRLDEARSGLERARAGAIEQGATPWLWRIDCERARTLDALGNRAAADEACAMARDTIVSLAASIDDEDERMRFERAAAEALPLARRSSARRGTSLEFGGLTARERDVAAQVMLGRTNREIADALVLSERTVETHVANIFSKLGFTSRAQLAAWGVEHGLGV